MVHLTVLSFAALKKNGTSRKNDTDMVFMIIDFNSIIKCTFNLIDSIKFPLIDNRYVKILANKHTKFYFHTVDLLQGLNLPNDKNRLVCE